MRTVEITIHGRVQGVFFRKYTQEKGIELGLKGWVKNQPDRSVKVLASGDADKVELLVRWCHQGSPMSAVDEVKVKEVPEAEPNNDSFLVLH